MFRNLLAFLLFLFLITVGCKEVSSFTESTKLSDITYKPTPLELETPFGFVKVNIPPDNPQTQEGVDLGFKLFHDPILSSDSSMACASCHLTALGMTDGKALSKGVDGLEGKRSAMSLMNVAYYREGLFWDGRVKSLEEQALLPVEDTIELHNNWDTVIGKLKAHQTYPILFRKAFGIDSIEQINKFLAAKAIAQYEKTLISGDSKFDQVERGEASYTPDEKAGYEIFFDANDNLPDSECGHCHNPPLLTTNEYLNNGISEAKTTSDFKDLGRGGFTGNSFDNGTFRVPTLRNIAMTAPYMHDGRFKTIEEVIDHYNSGGHNSPTVSPLIRPLNLNEVQKRQLIAFLNTLTDRKFVEESQQNTAY